MSDTNTEEIQEEKINNETTESLFIDSDDETDDVPTREELEENAENMKNKVRKTGGTIAEIILYLAIIVLCINIIPKYVVQRTIVDGNSMLNTLKDKENVLVEKVSYRFHDPDRFDVVVFYPHGKESSDYYIKRIIGLPGETVQIIGSTIYINGEELKENYGKDPIVFQGLAEEPIVLGDDEFFVLGDNREVSRDSRYDDIGPVKRENIAGKAILRIYPFDRFGNFDKGNKTDETSEDVSHSLKYIKAKETAVSYAYAASDNSLNVKCDSSLNVKCKAKVTHKKKIAIDAGHQLHSNSGTESVGPGSKTKKAKVSGGASGVSTGVAEYKLNLAIAKKLKAELIKRGYDVYMIRTKNNVNISNKTRALNANKSGADIYIRLHADSSTSSSARGASALYPSKSNPYVGKLSASSKKLSQKILAKYCAKTGIKNRGIVVRDDLTGTNWSKIPVTLIEMGFLSNPAEDKLMQQKKTQSKMAAGLADGIDAYFGY